MLIAPVSQIVSIGTQLTEGMAGLERTTDILAENPEDQDPRRTVSIAKIQGEVVFDDVDFSYAEGKQVLYDVSFRAQPGSVTALVGPSGAGKSTIIGLIAAFYTPVSGRVLVDGIDLSTVRLNSYRTQLGVVLQETFLFDGSIRENVIFSRPEATQEEVNAACRIARVDEFAESFAEGYNTVVGERGVKLSGGQRQRISIARAILADPRILILDEATSSLDSESEALIQEGLSYLMHGTHHLCDRAPALHHPPRRPDSGGGSGQDYRAGHARIALCRGRPVLRALHQAARPAGQSVSGARRRRFRPATRAATRGKTKRPEMEMVPRAIPRAMGTTTNRIWRARRDFSAGRRECLARSPRRRLQLGKRRGAAIYSRFRVISVSFWKW